MRVLILAPFTKESLSVLNNFAEFVHEDWCETGTIWDPRDLGKRLESECFDTVVIERDFLFSETFKNAPKLITAAICRSATNQIDIDAATESGVIVINTPGRNANAVAEFVVGLIFAISRHISRGDLFVRRGCWESPSLPYTLFRGSEITGKTVGILGFGTIGRTVAKFCISLGMDVLVHDPFVETKSIINLLATPVDQESLISNSDFLTLHCPALTGLYPVINPDSITRMRKGAFLINTADPDLVDSVALAEALRSGKLAGAAVDIFETTPIGPGHPLLTAPNTILTPHIGGATIETVERHSSMIVDDLRLINSGIKPTGLVNSGVWENRRVFS